MILALIWTVGLLALFHRCCGGFTILPVFLYRLKIQLPFRRSSLALSPSALHVWWGSSSLYVRFLLLLFSPSPLFRIAETQSSLSLLPLLSWIYCVICIVFWFLHVCVPVPLCFPFRTLYSLSIPFLRSQKDPSPTLMDLYSATVQGLGFTEFLVNVTCLPFLQHIYNG